MKIQYSPETATLAIEQNEAVAISVERCRFCAGYFQEEVGRARWI